MTTRILMIAHAHPDHSRGGGEIAAYNLHKRLNQSDVHRSVFLARHARPELLHGGTPLAGTGRPAEIVMYANMPDWFRFSQPDKALIWRDFRQTLKTTRPNIVHLHHYLFLGLELIREIRNFDPGIRIVMTLHEYWAICHNEGQMIKKKDQSLCFESSPAACHQCFAQRTPQDFMLRKLFIRSHFDLVDAFISPSYFLKDRYVAWGLAEHRVHVIENMLADDHDAKTTTVASSQYESSDILRLAFFGQINWFKGLDLLLDAIKLLPKRVQSRISLDINGSGLERQPDELRRNVQNRLHELEDVVTFRGAYTQSELPALMQAAHWMVLPSRWWENSPVVILEAAKHGLPVICSNIGGMAEKVIDGETGIHFQANRADSLADAIIWAINNPDKRRAFADNIRKSVQHDLAFIQHTQLYRTLLDSRYTEDDTVKTEPGNTSTPGSLPRAA